MRQAGHVARTGRRGMHILFLWESQKEIYVDQGIIDLREKR
jgi:hypothetical protein